MAAAFLVDRKKEKSMTLLSVLTGGLALLNYFSLTNQYISLTPALIIQGVLLLVTIIAAISYRGNRTRRSYDGGLYKIFTLAFAIIFISLLGNLAIFILLLLNQLGYVHGY